MILAINAYPKKIQIVAVVESWLHPDIPNNIVYIPGYTIIRSDRLNRIGGGVCVWCKETVYYEQIIPSCNQPKEIETVFLSFHSYKSVMCFIYVPPNLKASVYELINSFLIDTIDELLIMRPDTKICIIGDFNKMNTINLEAQCALVPLVCEMTRKNSILDQLFVPESSKSIMDVDMLSPIGGSDHSTIVMYPKTSTKPSTTVNIVSTISEGITLTHSLIA